MIIEMVKKEIDQEWVELMIQAKEMGIKKEEILDFLQAFNEQKEII